MIRGCLLCLVYHHRYCEESQISNGHAEFISASHQAGFVDVCTLVAARFGLCLSNITLHL